MVRSAISGLRRLREHEQGDEFVCCRRDLRQRGITARSARHGVESKRRVSGGIGGWSNVRVPGCTA